MRKAFAVLAFILLFIIFVGCLVFVVIQTDWFWKTACPEYLNRYILGIKVSDVSYSEKDIDLRGRIFFKKLKLTIQKDQVYTIEVDQLRLENILTLISFQRGKIDFKVTNVFVRSTDFNALDCNINAEMKMRNQRLEIIEGQVSCKESQFSGNVISDFEGRLQGSDGWLAVEDVSLNYRSGRINGRMTFGLNEVFPYVFDFYFHDVLFDQDVFDGNVLGKMNGTFQGNGFAKGLNGFEINMDAPQGAKIRADLLQSIAAYLPSKSGAKKELDAIIKVGGYVYFEISHAEIKQVDDHKVIAIINLKTNKLNLVLNPTVDINVGGGLQSIFNVLEFFSNPKG